MGSKLALQIVIGHVQSLRRSCEVCCWAEQQKKKDIEIKGKIKETFTSLLTLSTGAYSAGGGRGRCLLESLPICRQQLSLLLQLLQLVVDMWLKDNRSLV